ncbi:MAG: hypothetical protein ACXW4P_13825 [Thermoanaerobaculia bacterium]
MLAFAQWIRESRDEAERWLPRLLDLSGERLNLELERHPELQPGITLVLLDLLHDALDRDPGRAHELTTVLIEHAGSSLPLPHASVAGCLKGQAWTEHARALHGIGRYAEAREAVAAAFDIYRHEPMSAWHVAVAEVVGARILHDQGAHAEALDLLRPAAEVIRLHGSREGYVRAKMSEAWMQWDAGKPAAAAAVWRVTAEDAYQRGDSVLLALLDMRIAAFRLRHGSAEEAALRFVVAREVFDAAGMPREVIRALWGLAEANVARGLFHEAISEYYKVQGMLLADGDVVNAAVASTEILELLLIAGRDDKVLPAADLLVGTFSDAGLPLNPMRAWTFIRQRARAGALTREDLAHARAYFERLPLRPNAPFLAPEARP